ncbi:unnamed protein product [marine sediment metagenome]|uniref:SpoVT-AbrB domain-containing protein n=1 Tax=marine sediment metagenome TaxID=412755 RepID=X1JVY5_9ZZZZ
MPHKETRKLVRIGEVSVGVTLPVGWLRYFNLKAGDKVEVISNGDIVIKRKKIQKDLR